MAVVEQQHAVDFDEERLERVRAALRADIERGLYDGAALAVGRGDGLAFLDVTGWADREAGIELTPSSRYILFSTGKHFVNVVVMSYVERGLLALHEPVADVLPAFAARGKDRISLWHLLTQQSGMAPNVAVPPGHAGSVEHLTALAASLPPEGPPGTYVMYSVAAAHAVMASMLLAVDGRGRTFTQLMHDELFAPLGMTETTVGPPRDGADVARVVSRYAQDGRFTGADLEMAARMILTEGAEYPGGGYVTSITDFHRFAEMLRRGGELDGTRVLSPAMIELASTVWTGDKPAYSWHGSAEQRGWEPWPAHVGLGFSVRGTGLIPGPLPMLASEHTVGGWGAGTTAFWVDPVRDMSFALLTTGLLEETDHITRTRRLGDMVLAASTR